MIENTQEKYEIDYYLNKPGYVGIWNEFCTHREHSSSIFDVISAIYFSKDGNIHVCDEKNSELVIINPSEIITSKYSLEIAKADRIERVYVPEHRVVEKHWCEDGEIWLSVK